MAIRPKAKGMAYGIYAGTSTRQIKGPLLYNIYPARSFNRAHKKWPPWKGGP